MSPPVESADSSQQDVNAKGPSGMTALHWASCRGGYGGDSNSHLYINGEVEMVWAPIVKPKHS